MKITVLGAGTWGTALTILLAENKHEVTIWSKLPKEIEELDKNRSSIKNLPGAVLPDSVVCTNDLEEALAAPEMIVMAVASVFVRETSHRISSMIPEGMIIVNVAKGIEEATLKTLTEVIEDEIPQAEAAVLSGPSHAEEVSRKIPTTIVAGANKKEVADIIQDVFMTDFFRVYTSPDVIGIELGGSLKIVIALAACVLDGAGLGDNTKAALMTRGLTEMARLGVALGGRKETFAGLSGVGDLIVTATSIHSRNNRCGMLLGQGVPPAEAVKQVGMVVEGIHALAAAPRLMEQYQVDMPIVRAVNAVVNHGADAREEVRLLMCREQKPEQQNENSL